MRVALATRIASPIHILEEMGKKVVRPVDRALDNILEVLSV